MFSEGSAKANNISLKQYDLNKPASHIIHVEANNLYGHFIIQILPNEILDEVNQA